MNKIPKISPWVGVARDKVRYYKGLREKTDLHVHAKIIEQIKNNGINLGHKDVRVLDLGCGEGALSLRFYDEGADVVAVDVDKNNYKAEGPCFKVVDFDDPESVDKFIKENSGRFDVIVASEVIEHVRNPWELLETIKRLASPHTEIMISTPNVSSWWGRFWFFVTGELWGFSLSSWKDPGHINPITEQRFQGIVGDMGFEILSSINAGVLPIIWAYNWKRLAVSLMCLPFRLFQKGTLDGWVRIYRVKKIP